MADKDSASDTRKYEKVRRPPEPGTPVMVRFQKEGLADVDAWIENHPDPKPTRPEAVRQLVKRGLDADDWGTGAENGYEGA